MAEPSTTTQSGGALLLAALSAAVGPLLAEWTIVIAGASIGGCLAAMAVRTAGFGEALVVFLRGLLMGAAFSSLAAYVIAPYAHVDAGFVLWPVAVVIGWKQDRLVSLARALASRKGIHDA